MLPLIRPILYFCVSAAIALAANHASAEPMIISGLSFLEAHPGLGNQGIAAPGNAMSDDAGLGSATLELRIDLTTYDTLTDPLIVEPVTLMFGGGDVNFDFGPAMHMPGPPGPIGSGSIFAEITAASSTIAGTDFSDFVGGSFAFTYNAARITAGTGPGGMGGTVTFQSVPSASFTFAVVPEPASIAIALIGALGAIFIVLRWR